jgi:hypothetical protein
MGIIFINKYVLEIEGKSKLEIEEAFKKIPTVE